MEKDLGTPLGLTLAEYSDKGNLVPDEVMASLFDQTLNKHLDERGIILDGYPRTIPQVDTLLAMVNKKGLNIKQVLNIEVPEDELLQRALTRAKDSDREDDKNPETHIKRIRIFEATTKPAIAYMKEQLTVDSFDGMGSIEATQDLIKRALN